MMSFFKELQSKYQKQTLIISFVTGFVSDFLSPLGPILKYISILGFSILLIITLIYFLKKSDFFKNLILPTSTFSVMSSVFFFINSFSSNGILSDNITFINDFQQQLSIVKEDIKRVEKKEEVVEEKVEVVEEKVDQLSEEVFSEFEKIESLIEESNPFLNPKTADEFLINSFIYKNIGNTKKSIESFKSFFSLTNDFKIDLLIEFYQLLRSELGKNRAKKEMEFSEYSEYIYNIENLKGYKLFEFIEQSKVDDNIKKWTYIYKYYDLYDVDNSYPKNHKYSSESSGFTLGIDSYRYDKELGEDYILVEQYFYKSLTQIKLLNPDHVLAIQAVVQYMNNEESLFNVFYQPNVIGEEQAQINRNFVIESQKNIFMNGEF